MRSLQIGDLVKVDQDKYEAVYGFTHRDPSVPMEYVKIGWKAAGNKGSFVEMTEKHILPVLSARSKAWKMIPASKVKIGDEVQVDQDEERVTATVQSITKVQRKGAYTPLTFSGTITK